MGYFIITESNWAKLRNEILSLAETCHKAFGEQSKHTDWLHNGDVCKLLNISKRTLQHYRDTGVLPFSQIGHKCYYRREDVERLLQIKIKKSKAEKINSTNKHEEYGTGKSVWATNKSKEGAMEVANIIAGINPQAANYSEVNKLRNEIASHLQAEEKQAWNMLMQQQAHEQQKELKAIEAARAIGVAWAKNRPKTIYRTIIYGW